MESAHHFSSKPDCSSTADVPSFILRTALFSSTVCFGSMECWRAMIPWKIFTGFATFQWAVSVNDFRLFWRLEKLSRTPFRLLRCFCFARMRLYSLMSQILYHDCVSVTVARFTFFTENFVICCYQVTKILCTRNGSAIASSARALVILVLLQISQFRSLGKWV